MHRKECFDKLFTVTWAIPEGCLGAAGLEVCLLPSSPSTWLICKAGPRPSDRRKDVCDSCSFPRLSDAVIHCLLPPPTPGSNNSAHK